MSKKDDLCGAPAAIGMVVLALLFGGVVLAIYPSWPEIWHWIKSKNPNFELGVSVFIPMIASIAAAVSAYFSWKSLKHAQEVKKDDELLAHATVTLERAYSVLMEGSDDDEPRRNRMNWLVASRLILDYQDTKRQIKLPEIVRRCEGHEDFWRQRFNDSLSNISLRFGYYSEPQAQIDGNRIYPISAIVVHKFADWPDGRADDLDRWESTNAAIDELGISLQWASLRHYVGRL